MSQPPALEQRFQNAIDKIRELEKNNDTLREQIKAERDASYGLRCFMQEVAEACGANKNTLALLIVERVKKTSDLVTRLKEALETTLPWIPLCGVREEVMKCIKISSTKNQP